jgi:hypothetical protein
MKLCGFQEFARRGLLRHWSVNGPVFHFGFSRESFD